MDLNEVMQKIRIMDVIVKRGKKNKNQRISSFQNEIIYKLKNEVIEAIRAKNDYQNLVIALHTLASFQFSIEDRQQAEEHWLEALNSVFQKLHFLENIGDTFENDDKNENFVVKYGARSLHLAIIILYKLSRAIFNDRLEQQRKCLKLANLILEKLLTNSLPLPLNLD